jgi:uncharacterized protein (DUF169 family)
MTEWQEPATVVKHILGLSYEPTALKFSEERVSLPGFELPSERRYCQVLMGAREGQRLLLTADNVSCPAAAWALGFKEPPAKLSSGEMPAGMGNIWKPGGCQEYSEHHAPPGNGQIQDGSLLPTGDGTL